MASSRVSTSLVVGSGPAGSVAALVLARGGARVALVDKAAFPRDKACGDIVGPRGLQLLADLGVPVPPGRDVGDILVVGPTGRRVRLPCGEGLTYPGHGTAVTRTPSTRCCTTRRRCRGRPRVRGRRGAAWSGGHMDGFRADRRGEELRADFVIGADGATSQVRRQPGLVDPEKVLWGFAIRSYLPKTVELAGHRVLGADAVARFPRLRLGLPGSRRRGQHRPRPRHPLGPHGRGEPRACVAGVPRAPARGSDSGPPVRRSADASLGGWLKMGMVGTTPAAGRVLLAGRRRRPGQPAAGGGDRPGHGQRSSGRRGDPSPARDRRPGAYRARLAARHLPYHQIRGHAAEGH